MGEWGGDAGEEQETSRSGGQPVIEEASAPAPFPSTASQWTNW